MSAGSGGLAGGSTPSPSQFGADAMRSIRIPVGFLWLLAIVVIGLAALAYAFGVGNGRKSGFTEGFAAKLNEEKTLAMSHQVTDPLKVDAPSIGKTDKASPAKSAQSPTGAPANGASSGKSGAKTDSKNDSKASSAAAPGEDPRIKGVNYLVLAHPALDQADKMLAFCKAEGLDAYLVSDNNAKSRKLIVLPGLRPASALDTKEGKELVAKVLSVGVRWKSQAKGNRDFSDHYLELFR